MIAHVVLMKPRSDLTTDERAAFVDAFEHAIKSIPSVRSVRVGRRVRHNAGYEETSTDVDFLAAILFDDLDGLQSYLRHPAHQELATRFGQTMSSGMIYDCEVGGLDDLRRWRIP